MKWKTVAERSCRGDAITRKEAFEVLNAPDDSILEVVQAAFAVRKRFFGKRVKLNYLLNAKSGLCPEDCSYCSQSKTAQADVDKYPFLAEKDILAAAGRAVEARARRFCMVNSGRGPTDREVDQIASAVRRVREQFPQLEICVCLGLLGSRQAEALKAAGVDAYNHNLNTSESHYASVCRTHGYQDRLGTVEAARQAGLSCCSGCIFGIGEKDSDILDLAFTLRSLDVDSIPVNFLMPIPGTPLTGSKRLTPQRCLKILALFRFLNPGTELRVAGGREFQLRWLQPLALYIANSMFIGDYLTTKGQSPADDLDMIADLGFEIEGQPQASAAPAARGASPFAVELK